MYLILVKRGFGEINLIVDSNEELKSTINLALKAEYKIISVTSFNYELAKDFIEELKIELKPKGLVLGKKSRKGGK